MKMVLDYSISVSLLLEKAAFEGLLVGRQLLVKLVLEKEQWEG